MRTVLLFALAIFGLIALSQATQADEDMSLTIHKMVRAEVRAALEDENIWDDMRRKFQEMGDKIKNTLKEKFQSGFNKVKDDLKNKVDNGIKNQLTNFHLSEVADEEEPEVSQQFEPVAQAIDTEVPLTPKQRSTIRRILSRY